MVERTPEPRRATPEPHGLDHRREVEAAIEQAAVARQEGRYAAAVALLQEAMRWRHRLDALYYHLGNVYYDAGDLAAAEASYRRAIAINPAHQNAHHNLGVVLKRRGRLDEAVRVRREALRLALRHSPRAHSDARPVLSPWLIAGALLAVICLYAWLGG
ncbi:MAG TPA: tetratricopeptide repeat protein [Limnochordia bacterium]